MSHSRIFKLQGNLHKDFERIREEDYYDNGFLDSVGDYVDENTDVMDDYEWLSEGTMAELWAITFDGKIKDGDETYPLAYLEIDLPKMKKFYEDKLNEYVKIVAADPKKATDWKTERIIKGDFSGFYFDIDGCYYTDMEFVKYCCDYLNGQTAKFRLEGTLDYHIQKEVNNMIKLKTLYNKLIKKGYKISFIIDATNEQYPEFDYADEYLDTHGDVLVKEHLLDFDKSHLIVKFEKE